MLPLITVGASFYGGWYYGSIETRLARKRESLEQFIWWSHEPSEISVVSRRESAHEFRQEISISRGDESFTLDPPQEEYWSDLFVVSEANYGYALTKKRYETEGGFGFSRLVKIRLPSLNEKLQDVEKKTLFTDKELRIREGSAGRSWIQDIIAATADGSYLLLERAFPYRDAVGFGWYFRLVIYDVSDEEFTEISFESEEPPVFLPEKYD